MISIMKLLSFEKTKKLLRKYKIPILETEVVKTKKEAKKVAKKLGYPVVLKFWSPEILHRTEKGLVKTEIKTDKELEKSFEEILKKSKGLQAEGILVQKMARGIEVACGMKKDSSFGPVLMFGLGGVFIELLKDVSFQIAPISRKEALEMIKGIKSFNILKGFRGQVPVKLGRIADILVKLSKISLENPEIKEIDLNPVFVGEKRVQVADFKFIV